jgi:hypothetical protein
MSLETIDTRAEYTAVRRALLVGSVSGGRVPCSNTQSSNAALIEVELAACDPGAVAPSSKT